MNKIEKVKGELDRLGMRGAEEKLEEVIKEAEEKKLSYSEFLYLLMEEERRYKEEKRTNTLLKLANFPFYKTIEEYDFKFAKGVSEALIKELCNLNFIERRENIILLGPPGVGKTHLAVGIGIKACEKGKKVYFCDMTTLVNTLRGQNIKKLQFLNKISLLIIDEIGYFPISRYDSGLFFKLISDRYEKGSVIITSNKNFIEWVDVFEDEVLVAAMLDRLLHHCHVINIKGDSFRLKDKKFELQKEKVVKKIVH